MMMDGDNARRNLKDFLSMYNQFTETCFERCIQNLNYRVLTPDENSCTMRCVSKLINVNHREITKYMEINPLNRRLEEQNSATDQSEAQVAPADLQALAVEAAPTGGDGPIMESEGGDTTLSGESIPATESMNDKVEDTEKTWFSEICNRCD